ncbi:UDP-glucose 4-epimerase [Strigomonas culicis]|uniref:UDP-glucose 4-epimerase n=1 Tax=Strigomonas culicis TaxID=28005 RepID=S9TX54_9TRYP|nr:UDP-glucose 4-epimerase [Strigomonas culicis]|eukprot:EPY23062.1 UDP-glucose 4-epimerase [Strigomonas culicis]
MRRHRCHQLVFSSSAAVFGDAQQSTGGAVAFPLIASDAPAQPTSPYGRSKAMVETILRDCTAAAAAAAGDERAASQLRVVALRYFNVCGADGDLGEVRARESHLIPLLLRAAQAAGASPTLSPPPFAIYGGDYPTPDGTCVRDYIHVADIARAHMQSLVYLTSPAAARQPFTAVNVGTSRGTSVLEVVAAVRAVTGCALPVAVRPRRPGDPAVLVADGSAAQSVLGWRPQCTSIREMVESAWRFVCAHPKGYDAG